jgi:type II secretory pathway component PulK
VKQPDKGMLIVTVLVLVFFLGAFTMAVYVNWRVTH